VLRRLWEETAETVFLSVLRGSQRADLAVLVSPQVLGVNPAAFRVPSLTNGAPFESRLHSTSAGKVLLAGLPDADVRRLLAAQGLPGLTGHTLTDVDAVLAELVAVRRDGFASNYEEHQTGVCGVAAPVYDARGHATGALCIGYPAARATSAHIARLRDATVAAAHALSQQLGYGGPWPAAEPQPGPPSPSDHRR
jgi:DNA-binding IclR family transcriptional regulator